MRRLVTPSTRWVVGTGAAMAALLLVAPALDAVLPVLAAIAVIGLLAVTAERGLVHRAVPTAGGIVLALFALRTIAAGGVSNQQEAEVLAGCFAAAGATVLVGSLGWLVRSRHREYALGMIGDGIVVGLSAWIVGWVAITQPRLHRADGGSDVVAALDSVLLPIAALIVLLTAGLVWAERTRRPVVLLVAAGLVAWSAADVGSSTVRAHDAPELVARLVGGLHVVALSIIAAGFVHPSVASLESVRGVAPARSRPASEPLGRVVAEAAALVLPPVVPAIVAPTDDGDRAVRLLTVSVLALLAIGRVVHTIRTAQARQAELLRTAQSDPLTGLPNRSLLLARIDACLRESWHGEERPTVYFVDLDRFKNINDSLGHAAGDQVLRAVAERLRHAAPPDAMVARLSGDEYVVLDTRSLDETSLVIAERLLEVFREPLPLSQGDVFVTASVGIATISPNSRTNAEDLLRHADTAMYRAKDAGRNCVAFYDESMHERVAHRLQVETALYRALERRELRLFHQPILDIESGEVVGFEALMRWQLGDGTIVSPAEFIPIAEDTGTIVAIWAWALLDAFSQLKRWIDDGICSPRATMSVNVSPRQLADPQFPAIVQEAIVRSGVDPRSVWLEITESVMISEPELALSTLEKMRSLGVLIALDDFGTGYSSLSLLQRFPLQRIKIDRAFVQGVADSASDRSLVRTIVAMGEALGLDLVAEGVESVHQMQVLRDLGCHKAQGYLISHPVPADAMRSTVAALERLGRSPLLRGLDRSTAGTDGRARTERPRTERTRTERTRTERTHIEGPSSR